MGVHHRLPHLLRGDARCGWKGTTTLIARRAARPPPTRAARTRRRRRRSAAARPAARRRGRRRAADRLQALHQREDQLGVLAVSAAARRAVSGVIVTPNPSAGRRQQQQLGDALEHLLVGERLRPADVERAARHARARRAAAASISIVSRTSIGCVRNLRHAGSVSTGMRSTSRTSRRKERERAPITIEARSATESGTRSNRISSTSARLARWRETGPERGSRPPR